MATADVTSMLNGVKDAYAAAKSDADDAIASLKTYASAGLSATYDPAYEPLDRDIYPISTIKSVDDMLEIINGLADKIAGIQYVPPPPMPNFQMEDHKIWNDPFAEKIEEAMSDYLDTMGIPDKTFQDAIFNESYDRNLQTLHDLTELAEAKVGARGFTYPNSMVTILKLDAQQKYQFDRNQINRDVTKLVTEWARQNYHMAIEKGIAFEQFHADFTYKYCTAFVDIYKNMVLASIERFKADLARYTEPIRAYVEAAKLPVELGKVNADIQKANMDAFIESNKSHIQEHLGSYGSNVQVLINGFKTTVDALDSVAKQTATFVQAATRSVIGIQK